MSSVRWDCVRRGVWDEVCEMNSVGGRCVRRDVGDEVWETRCGICVWEMSWVGDEVREMFTHVGLPDAPGIVMPLGAKHLCLKPWSLGRSLAPRRRRSISRCRKCCACHAKAVGSRRRVQVLHCHSQRLAVMSFNKCHKHPSKACHSTTDFKPESTHLCIDHRHIAYRLMWRCIYIFICIYIYIYIHISTSLYFYIYIYRYDR